MQGVDTHAHVFSATAAAVAGARYRPPYAATLTDWRSRWAGAGITHGVLVQPSFFGTDNRELLAAIASAPGSLRGVAVVGPDCDDAQLGRLHAGGVRAIRLNLRSVADYSAFATSRWRDLFDRIRPLGWHVEVHVDSGRLPEIVPALHHSSVSVVFDHFGTPGATDAAIEATFAAVASLSASRPVWAKFSGPYRLDGADPAALAARWLDAVGPSRIVWGSDWPWTNHERDNDYGALRRALDAWVAPEQVKPILWDNAARLYDFA